ncbi:MAG: tetratricopeptide repeat protein [Planctomycetota bacterium]|nr:MAG: tetratricopeptide repeat protein [Planctomycetota bacterium]
MMNSKETIEERLQELGQAIRSDGSIVENVMGRIRVKSAAEQDSHGQSRGELIARRFIMNRFTKLAAAAVIIIAVALSITLFDGSVTPTYAIEQTVEAFKNVRFLHLVSRDEIGQVEDERWIEIGAHGRQVKYRQDTPPNFLAVEDGKTTAVYHKDKNSVVLWSNREKQYQWVGNLGTFLENLRQDGKIIETDADYHGRTAHKVLWPMMNAECYVDPQTKLPIAIGTTELSYEQPPPGTFEIGVPEGFVVVDKRPGASETEEPDWLRDEERADRYFNQARLALASGDYDEAVELFEYVVEKQPGRNWAWFWLGKAYYGQGRYDLAIEKYTKVLDMIGDQPYCNFARGLAYGAKGLDDAAREDFSRALPWMIRALREPAGAAMFEYADDPRLKERRYQPTEQQILARMINRLRIVTGQNFGYEPGADAEENERAITAWDDWFEAGGEIKFTPDAELVAVPAGGEQMAE